MTFTDRLNRIIETKKSFLCVGLDTDIIKLPEHLKSNPEAVVEFNKNIIEATSKYAAAYKINIAFYESRGIKGWQDLEKTLEFINDNTIVIADAKRGDIGNTSLQYAKTFFETYNFDAITVAPYMGYDSLSPFLEYEDKGIFSLCLTSNKGSKDFQYLKSGDHLLYQHVAQKLKEWNIHKNIGLVAGATHPEELKDLRELAGDMPFLIPGVGAQGGDMEAVLNNALTKQKNGILINSSRGIIFASSGEDYAKVAAKNAKQLVEQMREKL